MVDALEYLARRDFDHSRKDPTLLCTRSLITFTHFLSFSTVLVENSLVPHTLQVGPFLVNFLGE